MQRKIQSLAIILLLSLSLLGTLGATPGQGTPPPPYPDYFFGTVLVQGKPAPVSTQVVACIDNCRSGFQSAGVKVEEGGKYSRLEVNPTDRALMGHTITFYLVNRFGRIQAVEAATFGGGLNPPYILDLTFSDPMPTPPPAPTVAPAAPPRPAPALPAVGDTNVPYIPKLMLGLGALATVSGMLLLLLSRRRGFQIIHRIR